MGLVVSLEKLLRFPTSFVCFCLSSVSGRRKFSNSETFFFLNFKSAPILGGAMAVLKMLAYLLKFLGVILVLYGDPSIS